MTLSIRIASDDERLLARAAQALNISKSEFIRRSIRAYAQQVAPQSIDSDEELDARFIGRGGGLRWPESVADLKRRAVVERLRARHGCAG